MKIAVVSFTSSTFTYTCPTMRIPSTSLLHNTGHLSRSIRFQKCPSIAKLLSPIITFMKVLILYLLFGLILIGSLARLSHLTRLSRLSRLTRLRRAVIVIMKRDHINVIVIIVIKPSRLLRKDINVLILLFFAVIVVD